jgi:hypothetical protein
VTEIRPGVGDDARASAGRYEAWPVALVASVIVAGVFYLRLRFSAMKRFDADEFQHLHVAWCIAHGQLPYRDFFDHHLPLFHLLLSPLYAFFQVETRLDDAFGFLALARRISLALSAGAIGLTFLIGRTWRGSLVAVVALAVLAPARAFVDKSTEVRPDVLALVFLLAAVLSALSGVREVGHGGRRLALAGLLLGAGLMTSPKLAFAAPCFLVAILMARGRRGGRDLLIFSGAAVLPVAGVLVWLAPTGDLGPFVLYAIEWNAHWRMHFSPWDLMGRVFLESPLLCATGLIGFGACAAQWRPGASGRGADATLLVAAAGVTTGLLLNPMPWLHSFLPLFPFLALFGAASLVDLVSRLGLGRRAGAALLAATLALSAVHSWVQLNSIDRFKTRPQLEDLRWIMDNTRPSDQVLDTWTGAGVFRPHAWFFFCLQEDVRRMLGPEPPQQLLRDLESGLVHPSVIVSDDALAVLSPELAHFVTSHYTRVASRNFWKRNAD